MAHASPSMPAVLYRLSMPRRQRRERNVLVVVVEVEVAFGAF